MTSSAKPPLRVILIDDEPLARQELVYLLESADGVDIIARGSNGIEAVDLIRTHKPDLVFLDVQMPGLDGFAVLKKLLEQQVADAPGRLRHRVRPVRRARLRGQRGRLPAEALRPRPRPPDHREGSHPHRRRIAVRPLRKLSPQTPSTHRPARSSTRSFALSKSRPKPRPTAPTNSKVIVRAQSRLLLVDQREICFASIEDGAISVVTSTVEGQSNCRTLEELMDQLDPETFWRAHRSFVVNIQHIREVVPWFKSTYQLRMDDPRKTEIPVSRAQTKRLRDLFNL